jgi:hypothetical protein
MTTREGKAIPFQAVLPSYAAGVVEGDITPIVIYDQSGGTIGADEPLVYAALVTQATTAAPSAVVAKNSLGATVTWARTAEGVYTATASAAVFASGKTVVSVTNGNDTLLPIMRSFRFSDTVVRLDTSIAATGAADDVLTNASVIITVYP